jgi:PAS domain S-box-containing protein
MIRKRDPLPVVAPPLDAMVLSVPHDPAERLLPLGSQKRLAAQYAVMSALVDAAAIEQAAPAVLRALGDNLGWEVGSFWVVDGTSAVLRWVGGWRAEGAAAAVHDTFLATSRKTVFHPGEGLCGQAWETKRPIWIEDLADSPRSRRRTSAARAGLHAALAFPLRLGNRVLGVIELLAAGRRPRDEDLLLAVANVGAQLGMFVERLHAQADVKAEQERAAFIADVVPEMLWTALPNGTMESYNRRWLEYTGASADAPESERWTRVVHPSDLDNMLPRWQRSLGTGEPFEAEVRIRRATDGAYRFHIARAVPLKDDAGGIVRWVGTATDIDDQKQAESSTRFLAEASALLSESLEYEATFPRLARLAVPRLADWCALYLAGREGGLCRLAVAHSERERQALAEELTSRHPPHRDDAHGIGQVIRNGRAEIYAQLSGPVEGLEMLGELGAISAMILPLCARGQSLGALALATSARHFGAADVALGQELAERAAHAVDNARLFNDAQEAVKVRDEFLSIASHELKTPLTPLLLHIQSIQRLAASSSELPSNRVAAKLDTIERQVDRLDKLVNSLLDISRITGQRLQVECDENVDLVETVKEIATRFSVEMTQKGCTLELDAPGDVVGRWDRLRVEQIISNLLSNAIKFGAGRPIEVTVKSEDGFAVLTVRDLGIGIAPEDQARIFERFERAVAMRHYGGFGLGLWIVRQIVEALGGSIRVSSRVGAGSLFTVELPLVPGTRAASERGGRRAPDA